MLMSSQNSRNIQMKYENNNRNFCFKLKSSCFEIDFVVFLLKVSQTYRKIWGIIFANETLENPDLILIELKNSEGIFILIPNQFITSTIFYILQLKIQGK